MSDENFEILVLLRHYWKKFFTAPAAVEAICKVEGKGTVKKGTAFYWFNKFSNGDTSLEKMKPSGRPRSFDLEATRAVSDENPKLSTRVLAAEVGASQRTIARQLHEFGKVNRRCREVPHELTPLQAQKRVNTCKQLLTNPRDLRFIKKIVTCDEKWIYWKNPDRGNQWLYPGQPALPVPKRDRFEKKVMLCVWWNFEGIVHFELVPDGRGITAEVYSHQLERVEAVMRERYPALVNRKRVLLQQDNAPPHTARRTQEKIRDDLNFELLPHPAYSPDLAPSDYHLFRALAHFLRGRRFNSSEEVENGCREFFASKTPEWYRAGIEQLADRWLRIIDHNGLYFKE